MSKTELPTAIDSSWYGEMFVKVVIKISTSYILWLYLKFCTVIDSTLPKKKPVKSAKI